MAEGHHSPGAESSALNIRPIVWFLISLSVGTVIVCLLMAGLLDVFEARVEKAEGPPSPFAGERPRVPPEPRLQLAPSKIEQVEGKQPPNLQRDSPLAEMERLRKEEEAKLNSYGWVNQEKGIARIPIDEAKRLLLQRGLPVRAQSPKSEPTNKAEEKAK